MKNVFKYPLMEWSGTTLLLPDHAKIIHVGRDATSSVCVWAEVEPPRPLVSRRLAVFATGQDIPLSGVHLGTFIDGPMVWHVYELAV